MKNTFEIDFLKVLKEDEFVALVQMDLFHTGLNNNGSNITESAIENSFHTIFNKPIACILNSSYRENADDFESHAKNDIDVNNIVPVGAIPQSCEYKIYERDGRKYVSVVGVIWKYYLPNVVEILKNKEDNKNKISVEIQIEESHQDENDILVVDKFNFLSVFLLGDNYLTGMKDTNLKVIKFSLDKVINDSNKYFENFEITQEIKDTVKKALETPTKNRKLLSFANILTTEKTLTFNQVKSLVNNINKLKDFQNMKYLGGAYALDWCEKILEFEKGENEKVKIGHRELERLLWKDLSNYTFKQDGYDIHKYYIEEIYATHVLLKDNQSGELLKAKYEVDEDGLNAKIDMTTLKAEEDWKAKFSKEIFEKKEEESKTLKVNESKEKLSEEPWGAVDKGKIRKEVANAKNRDEVAPKIFLDLREGWKDGKLGAYKYPVMEEIDGEYVYNREALASAKAYATKNDEKEVLDKLEKIYKALDLDDKDKEKFEEMCKFKCVDYDDDLDEDLDEAKEDEKKKDDKGKENVGDEESKKEFAKLVDDLKTYSLIIKKFAESTDNAIWQTNEGLTKYLEIEAQNYKVLAEEERPEIVYAEYKKFYSIANKMAEEMTEKEKELCELREYKLRCENAAKDKKVLELLGDVKDILAPEEYDKLVNESKEVKFEEITNFENKVKAITFDILKNKQNFKTITVMPKISDSKGTDKKSIWE